MHHVQKTKFVYKILYVNKKRNNSFTKFSFINLILRDIYKYSFSTL